ncbi:MAG TPA: O-antigen ligase family protein [Chitinophagaceae bacterium]
MKNLFIIKDTLANKISYLHLMAFLVALPFDMFYSELVLISFSFHTLIHLKKSRLKYLYNKKLLIACSIFFINLFAILYSNNKEAALNDWGKQLALILFPILFIINPLNLHTYKLPLLKAFGLTCTITIIYLFVNAARIILYNHLPYRLLFSEFFMNQNFSASIGMHATYLSMYAAFSVIIFLYLFFKTDVRKSRIFYAALILILLAGLLQLSSRAVFIAFAIIINVAFPVVIFRGMQRVKFMLASGFICACILLTIVSIDAYKKRYVAELENDLQQPLVITTITEPRMARWISAMELVAKSPLYGYGSGTEKKLLQQQFFEHKLYYSYLNELNAHNQYLSLLLKFGIIGLLIYLYTLYFGFKLAIKKEDPLFLGFMIIIAIVSVSENILDVNKCIFFFGFFYSMFLFTGKTKTIIKITEKVKTHNRQTIHA